MASFDVDNLYTNVPIYETIEIILNEFFTSSATLVIGLTRSLFKNILKLAVLNSFFIFNGNLYRQREGLGMGLFLSPSCANIFMRFKEKLWLDQCPNEFAPVFYKRYIDDTFVLYFVVNLMLKNFMINLIIAITILNSLWNSNQTIVSHFLIVRW